MENANQEAVQWIQAIFMVGMLAMLGVALNKLKDLSEDFGRLWKKLEKMHELTGNVAIHAERVDTRTSSIPAGRFTVMVVGVHNDGSPFAWGMTQDISYREEKQVQVPFEAKLKKGTIVFCTGDAELTGVLVGNNSCTPWLNGGSSICFIGVDAEMGQHLGVRVRSNLKS